MTLQDASGIRPRVVSVATMYPNTAEPLFGIFVHRRLLHAAPHAAITVLAPVPYFPFGTLHPRYAHRALIPRKEYRDDFEVHYIRFLSIPRIWKPLDGLFLLFALWRHLRSQVDSFDLLDAHLAYPEGFACVLLGKLFRKPTCITIRGHDVNHLPRFPFRRRQIAFTLRNAARVMAVADALRREAVVLGAVPSRTQTIPNGVDRTIFYPRGREAARAKLGLPLDGPIVVSVGYLVERKGIHLVVEALGLLRTRGCELIRYVVIGGPGEEGNYEAEIRDAIARSGLEGAVLLVGPKGSTELPDWYSAADCSCLASSKEGWANVLLESLACGTPVVATNVWGTPEVITSDRYGILVARTPASLAEGILEAVGRPWDREAIVQYAHSYSWEATGAALANNYLQALREQSPHTVAATVTAQEPS